jgi:hypothetical protein
VEEFKSHRNNVCWIEKGSENRNSWLIMLPREFGLWSCPKTIRHLDNSYNCLIVLLILFKLYFLRKRQWIAQRCVGVFHFGFIKKDFTLLVKYIKIKKKARKCMKLSMCHSCLPDLASLVVSQNIWYKCQGCLYGFLDPSDLALSSYRTLFRIIIYLE